MKTFDNIVHQFAIFLLLLTVCAVSADPHQDFLDCLVQKSSDPIGMSNVISTPNSASYSSILNASVQNLRYALPSTPKPQVIITPNQDSQIQTAISCSKKHGLQVRILSGGHDFEGSSYVAEVPFFVLNMFNYRTVSVDANSRTAWVGAGASLGETYYNIVKVNTSLAYAAGYYPTVCIGGHVSGGGYGPLLRKFGLAADNVIDARVIDANGRILDRESMGEDLFWAIRGGVGASFAVILEYKIRLVEVSNEFTAFSIDRTLEQGATKLAYKWQNVAHKLPEDLVIELKSTVVQSNQTGKKTVKTTFAGLFEGGVDRLLSIMQENFPELGLTKEDCVKLSRWVDFISVFFELPLNSTNSVLVTRYPPPTPKSSFKSTADFVQKPIPEEGLEKIWKALLEIPAPFVQMNWTPFGARMAEIPASEIPFPHRGENIFMIFKKVLWHGTSRELTQERIALARKLHSVIGEFVENNPRRAYADYRDLDLGVNNIGLTSVEQARIWGGPYFRNNFHRLVKVKTMVDPDDYFRNEQSIPPLRSYSSSSN